MNESDRGSITVGLSGRAQVVREVHELGEEEDGGGELDHEENARRRREAHETPRHGLEGFVARFLAW